MCNGNVVILFSTRSRFDASFCDIINFIRHIRFELYCVVSQFYNSLSDPELKENSALYMSEFYRRFQIEDYVSFFSIKSYLSARIKISNEKGFENG